MRQGFERVAGAALALAVGGACLSASAATGPSASQSDWPALEGNSGSTHYSTLTQVNRSNVARLEQAWVYDLEGAITSCEPLVLPDRLIVPGPGGAVAALDPADGHELWRTEPGLVKPGLRGFSYWRSADGKEEHVFFPVGLALKGLNPKTGRLVPNFEIDLRQGLDRDPQRIRSIAPSTPGRVFENLLIVGSITGEGYESPPGDVRAFDVRTGRLIWTFHTIPRPGEFGYETWPKAAWTYAGGANDWGGMSIDEARGILYFVTGSPVYDFYGADRIGSNLFGNSIVAVDARTGKRLWHFQTVHHDIWDYDLVSSPVLLTVKHAGKPTPAVAVAGKNGFLFVFDRLTGKPLFPIEERPVPASDVPGEQAWPTQPFSTLPPFARQSFTEADLDPKLPEARRRELTAQLRAARNDGLFTPPALRDSVQMPGNHGGANWGQSGADLKGRFFITSFDLPAILRLTAGPDAQTIARAAQAGGPGAAVYVQNCQLCHGADRTGQPGVPSLVSVGTRLSDQEIRETVRNGKATMPGFPQLTAADLDALIGFLRSPNSAAQAAALSGSAARSATQQSNTSPNGSIRYRSGYNQIDFAIKPPWQTLTSYDLNTGRVRWQAPVGTVPGHDAPTGRAFVKAGLAITAGGLVFVATDADRKVHAFDIDTGKDLWSGALPSEPRGGVVVYMRKGRQYLVVPAGYAGGIGSEDAPGAPMAKGKNAFVAFALPRPGR